MENFRNTLRICPYSGEEFYPKRNNQKFAQLKYRIAYHNEINNKERRARAFIEKKLHRNFKILLELMKEKTKGSFSKEFLKGKGFSFDVLTNYEMYEGINRHAIYNFIISPSKNNKDYVTVIKN